MVGSKNDLGWTPPIPSNPEAVRIVLISECAANDPADNYGASPDALFDRTTLEAFALAGLQVNSVADLGALGIHLTVVLRRAKGRERIDAATIKAAVPDLAAELDLFPNARVYLLMGDIPIAAINHLGRERTGKRVIPAGSTYRIRGGTFSLGDIRLFPSYLQAGPAWYIEASKRQMVSEDIANALAIAGIANPA